MRRRPLDLVILAACAVVLVVLAYERTAIERKEHPSVYSTYDTGPNGYRALFGVLAAAGVPVQRFERELPAIDPSIKTLVLTGYEHDPSAKPLDQRDMERLRSFITGGGRFVAIDAEFAGPQDVTPGVGTSLQTPGGNEAIVLARNAYTTGVAAVRGSIDWTFPFKERHGIPLLANGKGMVAVWYRYGRGEVIAVTAPQLFGNEQLRNGDNLRFAYNVIAGHGAVAFDEFAHGYSESPTMWGVLPGPVHAAVWIVLALAVIALIGANVPFAPPYLANPPDERDSSHYITAVAELMRRSHRRPDDREVVRRAIAEYRLRKEHA